MSQAALDITQNPSLQISKRSAASDFSFNQQTISALGPADMARTNLYLELADTVFEPNLYELIGISSRAGTGLPADQLQSYVERYERDIKGPNLELLNELAALIPGEPPFDNLRNLCNWARKKLDLPRTLLLNGPQRDQYDEVLVPGSSQNRAPSAAIEKVENGAAGVSHDHIDSLGNGEKLILSIMADKAIDLPTKIKRISSVADTLAAAGSPILGIEDLILPPDLEVSPYNLIKAESEIQGTVNYDRLNRFTAEYFTSKYEPTITSMSLFVQTRSATLSDGPDRELCGQALSQLSEERGILARDFAEAKRRLLDEVAAAGDDYSFEKDRLQPTSIGKKLLYVVPTAILGSVVTSSLMGPTAAGLVFYGSLFVGIRYFDKILRKGKRSRSSNELIEERLDRFDAADQPPRQQRKKISILDNIREGFFGKKSQEKNAGRGEQHPGLEIVDLHRPSTQPPRPVSSEPVTVELNTRRNEP